MHLKLVKTLAISIFLANVVSFKAKAQCAIPTVTSQSGCAGYYTLSVSATYAGAFPASFNWYSSPSGSTHFSTSASTTNNTTWTSSYSATFNTSTSFWVSTVCSGGSESSRVEVDFTLTATSMSMSTSTDPMSVSTANNLTLTASGASNYQWRYGSILNSVLSTSASYPPTKGGMYYLTGTTNCSGVQIIPMQVNYVPVADAGVDQNISLLPSFTLYGSGYDSDGDALSYQWTLPPSTTVLAATPNLTLTSITAGTFSYRLTVTDSYGKSSYDDMVLTASALINNYNYLQEDNVLVPGQTSLALVQGLSIGNKTSTFGYQDDLGRGIEQVKTQFSPAGKDQIAFKVFDGLGKESTQYLPYTESGNTGAFIPVSTAISDQQFFFTTASDKIVDDVKPFGSVAYENSPLRRQTQQISPGNYWQTNNISTQVSYGANDVNVALNWSIDGTSGLPVASSPYYSGAELTKTITTDEQSINSETYTDFQGQKILTRRDVGGGIWAETYYVYDTKNNLKFILPPELIKVLKNQATPTFIPTPQQIDRWANQYNYDNLNRPIEFKAPGSGWVYTIYDSRNRVVLTQDANQRNGDPAQSIPANKWSFTKYDEQNRPVVSGIYGPDNTNTTRLAMQTYVNGLNSGFGYQNVTSNFSNVTTQGVDVVVSSYQSINDYKATNSISFEPGFTFTGGVTATSLNAVVVGIPASGVQPSAVFPTVNNEDLVKTYYDNYNCEICTDPDYQFVPIEPWYTSSTNEPFTNYTRIKGNIVASSIKILGTNTWLNTVSYYNRHGQVIQVIGANHLGGRDRVSTQMDFSGKKLEELHTAIGYNSGSIYSMRKVFAYDPVGRLMSVQHQINSQPMITMSALEYNDAGQVVKKKLHSTDGTNFLQKIDYRYSIHGALTNINNIPTTGDTGDDTDDYFGMDMTYEGAVSGTGAGNTPRKDGLISAIRWKQDLGNKRRLYNFTYDNLDRVTSSNQKMMPDVTSQTPTWSGEPDFYSETGISYDLNGNILSLNRNTEYFNGSNSANFIDQLSYTYGSTAYSSSSDNGNQLQFVSDVAPTLTKQLGFNDGGTNTIADPDYLYNSNGNLWKDQNKGIDSIAYYFNNLPRKIKFHDGSYLKYSYDAAGIKLSQTYVAFTNGSLQPPVITDYVGSMVLLQGQMLVVNHSEGRITAPTYVNLLSNPDAGSLDGYTANQNVALATSYSNNQTYVSATCNQATSTPGIFPINTTTGTSISVKPGESYTFKVLGYQASGNLASLYIQPNTGSITYPVVTLPVQDANGTHEDWVTVNFTVPSGVTSIQFGVQWSTPAVGNAFYINRVALYKTDFEYNYFITDQVGSTRVVLQTTPGTQVYMATMESQNQSTDCVANPGGENCKFLNMNSSQLVASPGNHTSGGTYAFKMNANFPVGPAKSIKVYPGDKIDASAFSFFVNNSGYNNTLASIAGNVISTFGGISGAGEAGSIYQNLTNAYATNGVLAGHTGSTTYPSAYLNYILFDKDYNPIQGQSFPISQTANSVQPLSMTTVTATELGYIYIYLSYENTNTNAGAEVYFDDFKITVTESPVIQVNNYYPFGMKSYTWLRAGETDNAYLYQGKELIAQTGWHDFGSRMYYPDLGRWVASDPQGSKMPSTSNYAAMMDNPVMYTDPDGECPICIVALVVGIINVAVHWDQITHSENPWGTGFMAFGIGAAAGALGAVTGGAAFTAMVGEGAAIGAGGFAAGAFSGAVGSAFASPYMGIGNQVVFGDPYTIKQWGTDVALGAAFGGAVNGIGGLVSGGTFWNGPRPTLPAIAPAEVSLPTEVRVNAPEGDLAAPSTAGTQSAVQAEVSATTEMPQNVRLGTGDVSKFVPRGRAPELPSGVLTEDTAMDAASKYLGNNYKEVSPGRFVSEDGLRQIRFGAHEVANTLHIHFESYGFSYWNGGRLTENSVGYIITKP